MTSDLYLILHKVRDEPAFDIAQRMSEPDDSNSADKGSREVWWLIPTSGHRAYPSWWKSLSELGIVQLPDTNFAWGMDNINGTIQGLIPMPYDVPDHYAANDALCAKPAPPVRRQPAATTDDFLL